ncbi:hypothetical protein MJO48_09755 [Dickeya fangzhongdai]|uniref:hypothetical protein n=1 Tax=Dickeya fangzhongdai TaxID=1778540 RepID=UPI001EFAFD2E|nr:hypothetical protein [Dickeya fangzhongdai]ULR32926.1 hypothetical protein MJO48_09755 [Dickeya fangzhongdai]
MSCILKKLLDRYVFVFLFGLILGIAILYICYVFSHGEVKAESISAICDSLTLFVALFAAIKAPDWINKKSKEDGYMYAVRLVSEDIPNAKYALNLSKNLIIPCSHGVISAPNAGNHFSFKEIINVRDSILISCRLARLHGFNIKVQHECKLDELIKDLDAAVSLHLVCWWLISKRSDAEGVNFSHEIPHDDMDVKTKKFDDSCEFFIRREIFDIFDVV